MYLGVDVGGTKTLVAVLNNDGVIKETRKFPTPANYHHFILELRHTIAHLEHHDFKAAGIGIPGVIDREHGIGRRFGNLPWKNVPILSDIVPFFGCPTVLDNDAKLAGLSEAMLLKDTYQRVLYVTVSTGIGYGSIINGTIDIGTNDAGGAVMLMEHKGALVPWESFASGRAIVNRYGKRAEDIHDQKTWAAIVRDLKLGLLELIAITQPEVIVIGGSVGTYFDRYHALLAAALKAHETPLLKMPALRQAKRPEEAVIYGCYDLAVATFGPKKEAGHAKVA